MKEITVNGYKLVIKAISPLAPKGVENAYRKQFPEPERPTYEIEAAGGIVETFEHTEETVVEPDEIKALEEYNEAFNQWNSGLTIRLMNLFLAVGVEIKLTKEQEDGFEELAEAMELTIPTGKAARKLFYLQTFVISDNETMEKVIQNVLEETGISSEAIAAAEETFPV